MDIQTLQNQIDELNGKIAVLERNAIQINIDPTISLYLTQAVSKYVSTLPTQTYSTVAPTGVAPTGSIWLRDTGVLATNETHVYSGSAWVQIK